MKQFYFRAFIALALLLTLVTAALSSPKSKEVIALERYFAGGAELKANHPLAKLEQKKKRR